MDEFLVQWVSYVVPWIESLGIAVVLWGILEAIIRLTRGGWSVLTQKSSRIELDVIRLTMATLGGIVVIRTVIVYFLNLELSRGAKLSNR